MYQLRRVFGLHGLIAQNWSSLEIPGLCLHHLLPHSKITMKYFTPTPIPHYCTVHTTPRIVLLCALRSCLTKGLLCHKCRKTQQIGDHEDALFSELTEAAWDRFSRAMPHETNHRSHPHAWTMKVFLNSLDDAPMVNSSKEKTANYAAGTFLAVQKTNPIVQETTSPIISQHTNLLILELNSKVMPMMILLNQRVIEVEVVLDRNAIGAWSSRSAFRHLRICRSSENDQAQGYG